MRRLTPYIFFLLAILAFVMIAMEPDDSWQSEKVDILDAVLVTAGVLIGAHLLRKIAEKLFAKRKDRRE